MTQNIVHAIIDTNSIYSDSSQFFLSHDAKRTINEILNVERFKVNWHVPYVVHGERRYQMLRKAEELRAYIRKIENFLGSSLNLDDAALYERVNILIDKEISEFEFNIHGLDPSMIDLMDIVERSINRGLPFETTEKTEKGFRDAMILEGIKQLIPELLAKNAKIYIITSDKLLRNAVNQHFGENEAVGVLSSLSDLLNELAAEGSGLEGLVDELLPKARELFLEPAPSDLRESSLKRIQHDFGEIIRSAPSPDASSNVIGFSVLSPRFISKEGDEYRFESIIQIAVEATISEFTYSTVPANATTVGSLSVFPGSSVGSVSGDLANLSASENLRTIYAVEPPFTDIFMATSPSSYPHPQNLPYAPVTSSC